MLNKRITWLSVASVFLLAPVHADAWFIRSTANQWAATPLTALGADLFEVCQRFSAGDANGPPRFKIDRFGDWSESYPSNDQIVEANQSYRIVFNATDHDIGVELVTECRSTPRETSITLYFHPDLYSSAPTVWAWISGGSAISKLEGYSWDDQETMTVDPTSGYYQWKMDKKYQPEIDTGLSLNIRLNKTKEFSRQRTGCYTGKRWYDQLSSCTSQFTPYIGPYLTLTKQVVQNPDRNPAVLDPATHMIINYELKDLPAGYNAAVQYRRQGSSQWITQQEDEVESFGNGWGKVHHITLSDLTPNTGYEYRIVGPANVKSEVYHFKTAQPDADFSRFLIIGDMQDENRANGQRWADIADAIVKDHMADFDFIITVGDMVKDDISENGDRFYWWKVFFDKGYLLFAHKPMLPAMGNHDTPGVADLSTKQPDEKWHMPYWSNAEDTLAFRKYFYLKPDMRYPDYYSYQFGNACFISGNSEIPVFYGRHPERDPTGNRKRKYELWLDAEVNKAQDCTWSFAYWHVPAINPVGRKKEVKWIRPYVNHFNEKLDWLITGHVHEYQRLKPIEATSYQVNLKAGYGRKLDQGVGYLIAPPAGQYPRNTRPKSMDYLAFYPHNRHGVGCEIGFSIVSVNGLKFSLQTYGMGSVGDRVQPKGYRENGDRSKKLLDKVTYDKVTYDKLKPQLKKEFERVDFRGTSNNWGKTSMMLVADYTWEVTVSVPSTETNPRFKFFANGRWYGDDDQDGETHSNERASIKLAQGTGSYRIRFVENTRKYVMTKLQMPNPVKLQTRLRKSLD